MALHVGSGTVDAFPWALLQCPVAAAVAYALARAWLAWRPRGMVMRVVQIVTVLWSLAVVWSPPTLYSKGKPVHDLDLRLVDLAFLAGTALGFATGLLARLRTAPPEEPRPTVPFHRNRAFWLDYALGVALYWWFVYAGLRLATTWRVEAPELPLRLAVSFAYTQLTAGLLYRLLSYVAREDYRVGRSTHYALLAVPMALSLTGYAAAGTWPAGVPFNLLVLYLAWRYLPGRPASLPATLAGLWRYARGRPAAEAADP